LSSTDDALVQRFFRKKLVPAAAGVRRRGATFYPAGPDDAASWYCDGPEEPDLMEIDEGRWAPTLQARWQQEGLPELAALAGPLVDLAARLRSRAPQSAELSPFIYVIY